MKLFTPGQGPKLALLPALTLGVWFTLWSIAIVAQVVHVLGWWLEWWPHQSDVSTACAVAFILLAFTPLDFSRGTVVYLVRRAGDEGADYLPITRWQAWKLRKRRDLEVHRVRVRNGQIIHGERVR